MMVRLANENDRLRVVRLMKEQAQFAGFEDGSFGIKVPLQASYGVNLFNIHIMKPNCVCIVCEDDKVPNVAQGMLMAAVSEHPMAPIRIAKDTAFYIREKYRGGTVALKMIRAFEEWALKDQRCHAVVLGALSKYPEVKILYERLGYKEAEITYVKQLPR